MNAVAKTVLGFFFVTTASFATSLHPNTFHTDVAPSLHKIKITEVGSRGSVLRSRTQHPFTEFLIGIPAKVSTESACTTFVGQNVTSPRSPKFFPSISAMGATDPLIDACIEIFPAPVDTTFTVSMKVVTGGIVAAKEIQHQVVQIEGNGLYSVILDMGNNSVRIKSLKSR